MFGLFRKSVTPSAVPFDGVTPLYRAGRSLSAARASEEVDLGDPPFIPSFVPTGLVVGTAGTVVGQLLDDEEDVSFKLAAGMWPLAFKSITSGPADMVVVSGD